MSERGGLNDRQIHRTPSPSHPTRHHLRGDLRQHHDGGRGVAGLGTGVTLGLIVGSRRGTVPRTCVDDRVL